MPNPYHFRAHIDRLWRRSGDHNPGYIRLKALNAVVRELFAPNDRARRNYQLYLATDPYDVGPPPPPQTSTTAAGPIAPRHRRLPLPPSPSGRGPG